MRGDSRTELTAPIVELVARSGAEILGADGFAVARDTRESGPVLANAVHTGVSRAGGHSVDLGVVPTPAAALWCRRENVAAAVVSASHNPWHDNGIKFFAPGGLKPTDDVQAKIQRRLDDYLERRGDRSTGLANGTPVGEAGRAASQSPTVVDRHDDAVRLHIEHVTSSLDGRTLDGLVVVVDTANGAATTVAAEAFKALGAAVIAIHCRPDGRNINDRCGSTHPDDLRREVVANGADAGIAFDGDADRLIAVGPGGEIVDGDRIIAMCALDRHRRGVLSGDAVVVTVMTNLGFRRSMSAAGIEVVETAVGDRNVLEALDRMGLSLGGEQSGHVIFRDISTTGDGLLTAIQLLDVVRRSGGDLGRLAVASMDRLPQVLVNVEIGARRSGMESLVDPVVAPFVEQLGDRGRVLVRFSGTEPLVRVMVEAETDAEAAGVAAELSDQIRSVLH